MKIKLKTVEGPDEKPVLYFPFMAHSDIHWLTEQCRAKKLSRFLENTRCGERHLIGDIIDGERLLKKQKWNCGPWHRQGMAHVLRQCAEGTRTVGYIGNHEVGLSSRNGAEITRHNLIGKQLFGVEIVRQSSYMDPQGRNFWILHGDQFDAEVFDPKVQEMGYKIGNSLLELGGMIDANCERLGLEFSICATGKRHFKTVIQNNMGVRKATINALDNSDFDGLIYGHTHMGGFETTPAGKLKINDGCSTDHVQCTVHDEDGNWALLEPHRDYLRITEPDGNEEMVAWKDIGMAHYSEEPSMTEDKHTMDTDRFLRLVCRKWPALDRQKMLEEYSRDRELVRVFEAAVGDGYIPSAEEHVCYLRKSALAATIHELPIPHPTRARNIARTELEKIAKMPVEPAAAPL